MAGLVSLINVQLGRQLIAVAGIALVAAIANALTWALIRVYLLDRLDRKRPSGKK